MRKFILLSCVGVGALLANGAASANEQLVQMSKNPKDWVMPAGNYDGQRYTALKQITPSNVKSCAGVDVLDRRAARS